MKNFVMNNVGSSLLSMNCGVSTFRAGSVIADLWIELFAVSQTNADSLAQDVTNLASDTNNTALTAGAESLSVSSLSLTVTAIGRKPSVHICPSFGGVLLHCEKVGQQFSNPLPNVVPIVNPTIY